MLRIVIVLAAGCREGDSPGSQPAAGSARQTALETFARRYLVHHVCPDAPTPERLAHRIAQVIRERPGTSWPAAAMGVCNKTRH